MLLFCERCDRQPGTDGKIWERTETPQNAAFGTRSSFRSHADKNNPPFQTQSLSENRGLAANEPMLVSDRELDLRMTEQQANRARIVREAIASAMEKLEASHMKPTLADLVRLLQIEKELDADEPREIVVRWVETATVNALKER
jgi:hypothetical protein